MNIHIYTYIYESWPISHHKENSSETAVLNMKGKTIKNLELNTGEHIYDTEVGKDS